MGGLHLGSTQLENIPDVTDKHCHKSPSSVLLFYTQTGCLQPVGINQTSIIPAVEHSASTATEISGKSVGPTL